MTSTTPDIFDRLTTLFQSAIASIQQNVQLSAENAQLKAEKADLQTRLDAVTSSLNEDEQQKATNATKLAAYRSHLQKKFWITLERLIPN